MWDELGHVMSSQYRIEIMRQLAEGVKTPSTIRDNTDENGKEIPISHVSRTLGNLRNRDLVNLKVPEERKKGRYYGLSELGEEIWEHAKSEEMQ